MSSSLQSNLSNNSIVNDIPGLKITFDPEYHDFLQSKYAETCQYPSDAGFDLFMPTDVVLEPKKTTFINLRIRGEYSNSTRSYGYFLVPRSSISKTTVRLANSVGVFDPNYRGYMIAAVDNIGSEPQLLKQGKRYFQLVFVQLNKPSSIEIVSKLSETDRGNGGFGSTGK